MTPSSAPPGPRPTGPRHPLPNGRAVTGGLLVALATLGGFAATTRTSTPPATRFAVTTHAIDAGERIGPDDVTLEPIDLPAATAGQAFGAIDDVSGALTIVPVGAGALLQRGDLLDPGQVPDTQQLSFSIAADRAVAGTLRVGDRIDLLVTYGTGADAYTIRVVRGAAVVAVSSGGDSFGADAARTVTLALADPDDALAVAHSVRAGEVTLVRTTGLDGGPGPAAGRYQPPPPRP